MSSKFGSIATGAWVICCASLTLGCGGSGDDSGAGGTSTGGSSAAGTSAGGSSGHAGASAHGGSGGGTADTSCPGTIVAEWDVDGTHNKSSTALFTDVGTAYTFTLVSCSSGNNVVEFGYFPSPISVANFTLKDTLLGGMSGSISGALYGEGDTAFKTDPTHMGTLKITSLDSTAMTADGTFEFEGVSDDGTTTHSITNGVITKMKYSVLMP